MNGDDQHRQNRIAMLRRELQVLETGSSDTIDHGPASVGHESYADYARAILTARARLAKHFEASLFSDPAFDILLCLFAATEDGHSITTNACCTAARVPRTTALRWIKLLTTHGHVIAIEDPSDRRSTLLHLSSNAGNAMKMWLDECAAIPLYQ